MHHIDPVGDGGAPFDGHNLTPMQRDAHVAEHKANDDLKRYGARGQGPAGTQPNVGEQMENEMEMEKSTFTPENDPEMGPNQ
jgi:hypothetical protein